MKIDIDENPQSSNQFSTKKTPTKQLNYKNKKTKLNIITKLQKYSFLKAKTNKSVTTILNDPDRVGWLVYILIEHPIALSLLR